MMAHDELIGHGMVQIIKGPTHRFNGHESTIDLIFTNEPGKISEIGQIATGSGHDCVWMLRESVFVIKKMGLLRGLLEILTMKHVLRNQEI